MRTIDAAPRPRVLPSCEELAEILPRPGGPTWERASDARLVPFTGGRALLMQVAHPTVAAGVREHSDYATNPWGRLIRTLDYTMISVYGGPAAAASTGERLRETHKHIKGTAPDGKRYFALEPTAFAWVHATLIDSMEAFHRRFGDPMRGAELERFYSEMRAVARVPGVRAGDLPETWAGFRAYVDEMIATTLEDNDVVQNVLQTVVVPPAPPQAAVPASAWRAVQWPAGRVMRLATAGMLPPVLRARFGLDWTESHTLQLRALGRVSRASTRLMPRSLRVTGPAYLKLRPQAATTAGARG